MGRCTRRRRRARLPFTVRIGAENPQSLTTASLVAASYGGASDVTATPWVCSAPPGWTTPRR